MMTLLLDFVLLRFPSFFLQISSFWEEKRQRLFCIDWSVKERNYSWLPTAHSALCKWHLSEVHVFMSPLWFILEINSFVAISSLITYIVSVHRDKGMTHMVGKDWRDFFDVVIVQADKPHFFTDCIKWVNLEDLNACIKLDKFTSVAWFAE